jgi:hypothetical protein
MNRLKQISLSLTGPDPDFVGARLVPFFIIYKFIKCETAHPGHKTKNIGIEKS